MHEKKNQVHVTQTKKTVPEHVINLRSNLGAQWHDLKHPLLIFYSFLLCCGLQLSFGERVSHTNNHWVPGVQPTEVYNYLKMKLMTRVLH